VVTITGSFLSADCFWQPVAESAAPAQAIDNKVLGRRKRRSSEDGKADDVAFVLMVSLSPWERVPIGLHAADDTRLIDRREKKTISRGHFGGLVRIASFCLTQFLTESRAASLLELLPGRPNRLAMVPT
jgi:hypothetical protein